ncbi:MAG: DMT family transporter [Phototrophicaceae bacterium]|jgi:drug/metabolite transporter (DMT)-like permease
MASQTSTLHEVKSPRFPVWGALTVGMLAISFAAILIRYAQQDGVPSLVIAASRLVISGVALTPFALTRYRQELRGLQRRDLLLALLSGVCLALHFAFWVTSLEYTTVLISVTLVTTTPLWTAILEAWLLKASFHRWLLIGLLVSLVGGVMIGFPSGASAEAAGSSNLLLGAGLALLGALVVAGYMTIGRGLSGRLSLVPYIWLVYGFAGIVLSLIVLAQGLPVTGYPPSAYFWLLAQAVFPQMIGHTSLNYAVRYVSATYTSIATKLEPIGSAVLAYFLFSEVPGVWQIIGSVVILAGVVVASVRPTPSKNT